MWLRAWPRGELLGRFLLKSSFRIESGIGEDGREVLTSEPQREVASDSSPGVPAWLLREARNYRSGVLAPHDGCFSCLELVRPLVSPSPVHFHSNTHSKRVVSMCPV